MMENFNKKNGSASASRRRDGYSLIETVVYITLIAIMLIVSTSSIITVYRTFGVLKTERKISINGDMAMETMIRDIRAASTATTNQGSSTLTIGTITYTLSSAQITKQVGISAPQAITGTDVRVLSLQFYKDTSPNSEIISLRMQIESGSGQYIKSKQYYGSAVIR